MNDSSHRMLSAARSVGVFGGTFDPVHNGHLLLAECAVEELGLDVCLFMPAFIPPHKRVGRAISSPEHRLNMLRAATAGNLRFCVSEYEIERADVSYTAHTLAWLRAEFPAAAFTLLLGADSARDFHLWHRPEAIVAAAEIAAWARRDVELPAEVYPGTSCRRIGAPVIEISSTDIRERVAAGRSVRYRTPDAVIDYINKNGLYR